MDDTKSVRRVRVLLGACTFLVFFCSPVVQMFDAEYSMLMADSLLRYGTADLSHYSIPNMSHIGPPLDFKDSSAYQLGYVRGKLVYCFPHGSSWLSVPFLGLLEMVGISPATRDGRFNLFGEAMAQKLLASALMAALTILVFQTCLLMLNERWSLIIAVGFAFGTQVWSTASRAMWSHTWEIVLGGGVVYLLLRAERLGTSVKPALLGTLLGWMYFVRPTGAVAVIGVSAYVALFHRRDLACLVLVGLGWFAAFTAESLMVTGSSLPVYYGNSDFSWRYSLIGIPVDLISPSRGLLVYVPAVLFLGWTLLRYWRLIEAKRLAFLALAVSGGLLLMVSSYAVWWGGECYGARYMTDALPWLVLLAILALKAVPAGRLKLRNPEMAAGLLLLVLSVAINSRGALSWSTGTWTRRVPLAHVQDFLDWSYPQFMAGMMANPYGSESIAPTTFFDLNREKAGYDSDKAGS